MRASIRQFVNTERFRRGILVLIVINAVTLGMETSKPIMAQYGTLLHGFDIVVLLVFSLEIILRIIGHGRGFFRDAWSLFDFAVVAVAWVPHGSEFAVLRTLRVLRVLRVISMIPSMRRVIEALLDSLGGVMAVAAIMLVIFYVFSVIAATLFAGVSPEYFGTLSRTMLTLFQIMTLEEWAQIARPIIAAVPYSWLFFVSYILISTFVVLNLFIGVVVYAIQHTSAYTGNDRRKMTPEQRAALTLIEEQGLLENIRALRLELAELKEHRHQETTGP